MKKILDMCCGSRMFWFNRQNPETLFCDIRREQHELRDKSSKNGTRLLNIEPDIQHDFTSLPFKDGEFAIVVFDPPHLIRNGDSGWLAKKYGKLKQNWHDDIRLGFAEAFRVLKKEGTLIFKWNETDILVSEILKLTPVEPLFGNRCGKNAKSHWIVFLKQ